MSESTTKVTCPTCGQGVVWQAESLYRPFCSKRCQLIDLGEWANEEKRIPSDDTQSESDNWTEKQP